MVKWQLKRFRVWVTINFLSKKLWFWFFTCPTDPMYLEEICNFFRKKQQTLFKSLTTKYSLIFKENERKTKFKNCSQTNLKRAFVLVFKHLGTKMYKLVSQELSEDIE